MSFWTWQTTRKRVSLITAAVLGSAALLYGAADWILPYPDPGRLPAGARLASKGIFGAHAGCASLPALKTAPPVAYLFVNGIRTDVIEDEIDTRALRDVLCSDRQLGFRDLVVEFDDPANPPVVLRGDGSPTGATTAVHGEHRRKNVIGNAYAFIADIEAARAEEHLARARHPERSWRARRLVGMVTTFLNTGYRVVLVPHSRGTSVTKTAVQALVDQLGRQQAAACIAVVAVAPVSRLNWPSEISVHGLYAAAGERDEAVNAFARPILEFSQRGVLSPSARERDDSLQVRFPTVRVTSAERLGWSPAQLHSFVETYLGDGGVRRATTGMIRTAARTVRGGNCRFADESRAFARIEPYRDPGEVPVTRALP